MCWFHKESRHSDKGGHLATPVTSKVEAPPVPMCSVPDSCRKVWSWHQNCAAIAMANAMTSQGSWCKMKVLHVDKLQASATQCLSNLCWHEADVSHTGACQPVSDHINCVQSSTQTQIQTSWIFWAMQSRHQQLASKVSWRPLLNQPQHSSQVHHLTHSQSNKWMWRVLNNCPTRASVRREVVNRIQHLLTIF